MTKNDSSKILFLVLLMSPLLVRLGSAEPKLELLIQHFTNQRTIGQVTASASNMQNIATAISMYQFDHKRLPNKLSELTPDYLRTLPKDALPSSSYRYKKMGKGFEIARVGPMVKSPKILKGYPKLVARTPQNYKVYYAPNKLWSSRAGSPELDSISSEDVAKMDRKARAEYLQRMRKHMKEQDAAIQRDRTRRRKVSELLIEGGQLLNTDLEAGLESYRKALRVGIDNPLKRAEIKRFLKVIGR